MQDAWRDDDRSVTPIIGTILVLAITVLGVSAVMFWGAPTIQQIQDRNAQLHMIGEFEEIRLSSLSLSVPDAARTPTIVLQQGEMGVEKGTRFMVTVSHDPTSIACDMHIRDWHTAPVDSFTLDVSTCVGGEVFATATCGSGLLPSGDRCLEVYRVSGSNIMKRTVIGSDLPLGGDGIFTVENNGDPEDLTQGNWMFRLTDNGGASAEVYAQAWLLSSDMHAWRQLTTQGVREVYQDGGAIFSFTETTFFLELNPPIQEDAFGSGDYVLWLRTYDATAQTAVTGRMSITVHLGLVGTYTRINEAEVNTLRYDFHGQLAEAWCHALLSRNPILAGVHEYTEDPAYGCASEVPSVIYRDPGTAEPFPMEFLHAHIRTRIQQ